MSLILGKSSHACSNDGATTKAEERSVPVSQRVTAGGEEATFRFAGWKPRFHGVVLLHSFLKCPL